MMGRVLLLIGFAAYVASYFLPAARETAAAASNPGFEGYWCAYVTLISPWGHSGMEMLRDNAIAYFGILFSGWINPLFLITMVMSLVKPAARVTAILRVIVIVMFAAVWVVFYQLHLRPRPGYFLWTAAMLVVLFSSMVSRRERTFSTAA